MQQLTSLPESSKLSELVLTVLDANPSPFTLQGSNTYLIGSGPRRLMVDTGEGTAQFIPRLRAACEAHGVDGLERILISHHHADHIGGLDLVKGAFGYLPVHQVGCELGLKDGQVFVTEDKSARVQAICTPGHCADHVCFYLQEEKALFSGDCILGQGTTAITDLGAYLESLERLQGLDIDVIYPAHGPVIHDPQQRIQQYIDHRNKRISQVAALLRTTREKASSSSTCPARTQVDAWSSLDLVQVMYADVDSKVHMAAAHNTLLALQLWETRGEVTRIQAQQQLQRLEDTKEDNRATEEGKRMPTRTNDQLAAAWELTETMWRYTGKQKNNTQTKKVSPSL
jgi:ribonuclease/clavin/mitogillin